MSPRVAVADGYMPATLARRWISDDAWAILPEDTTEALVFVVDTKTDRKSTIIGDARLYRAYKDGLDELRESGEEDAYVAAAQVDLAPLLPIEREGHPDQWLEELAALQGGCRTSPQPASFAGYL